MRQHALNMGLTMNEHGLNKMEGKTKGEKVAHIFKTERDIFDYLQLSYVAPEERIDGRQLVKKVTTAQPKLQIITQFDEEPIQLGPKAPKVTKAKTLKAKKVPQKVPQKVNKKIVIESESPLLEKDFLPKVDTFPDFLKEKGLALPLSKVDMESLTEEELTAILNYANTMYRNFQPIMTDNEYDILEDYIKEKYPNNKATAQIGAPVTKNKATLPYFMGSMDKIKPDTNALANWKSKYVGPYVLSCKLDGVSGLYTTEGPKPKLYTRGDGKVGQDISYLIPYLRLPKNKGLVIRGEFIIAKSTFNLKYKATFANARNMVSGIVNQKSVNPEIIKDVDFVSYELIKPLLKPSEQMATLQKLDINVTLFKKVEQNDLTNQLLSETLVEWRSTYPYEIDGVIVANDQIYPQRKEGNPEHAFAFKMVLSDQIAEAKVVDVIWTPSKDGYLKPRVQIEPIHLGGVKIEYATGFNGQFIEDNKVGIGAVIELIRSGDVIPHIRKVTTPASQAKMPSIPYKWNDTHVDVLLEDIDSDEIVKEKNITGFFRGLEVEGLSSGNIKRMIQAGFDSVPKILRMTTADLLQVEGFKEKTAQKLYNNIQTQIQTAPLVKIMAASNIFGRGFSDKKMELILESYPNVLTDQQHANKVAKIASIKGMATKTAEAFVERIPAFLAFLHEANLEAKLNQSETKQIDQSHPLYNKSIVFTGFRDKVLEEQLKALGAKIGSSISKNTFVLITKDPLDETGKVLDAKKLNVPIMTPEEFKSIHIHL
jgi:NAD-dependent DNA ligase